MFLYIVFMEMQKFTATKHNIIIVDDHKMFLSGLLSILKSEAQFNILKATHNANEVVKYLTLNADTEVDLIITDINMPEMDGIELHQIIKEKRRDIKTLVISMLNDPEYTNMLIINNVNGYISKNASKQELLLAIESVLKGGNYFSKEIKDAYLQNRLLNKKNEKINLTKREIEVITLIAEEHTTNEIAEILFLSKHTVESYRKNIIRKLEVRNLAGLTKFALKMKYIKN
ncbi:response regulator transcription factor [Aquimarina agarivorans]|uniref:response regulator transcription factor n=1 Tax=Aquimarina agarivorans TaxID=980584 RepID=UPI000248F25F|nr:response regulator transcription factor [Aquimarina agarivorans]